MPIQIQYLSTLVYGSSDRWECCKPLSSLGAIIYTFKRKITDHNHSNSYSRVCIFHENRKHIPFYFLLSVPCVQPEENVFVVGLICSFASVSSWFFGWTSCSGSFWDSIPILQLKHGFFGFLHIYASDKLDNEIYNIREHFTYLFRQFIKHLIYWLSFIQL